MSVERRIAGNVLREQSTRLLLHWVNCSVNKFLYFWLLWDVRGRQIWRRSQSHRSHDDHFCHRQWLVKRGEKHALLLWISRLNDPTYWVIIARMTQFIVGLVSVQLEALGLIVSLIWYFVFIIAQRHLASAGHFSQCLFAIVEERNKMCHET